jgi:hypothetical protein
MTAECYPLRVLLIAFAGWVHRERQRTIEYLVEENGVLKEQLKGRKLRLNDDQRRRGVIHEVEVLVVRMAQVARDLTDAVDGFLLPHRFLICDRDTKFTARFQAILKDSAVDPVITPYRRPAEDLQARGVTMGHYALDAVLQDGELVAEREVLSDQVLTLLNRSLQEAKESAGGGHGRGS